MTIKSGKKIKQGPKINQKIKDMILIIQRERTKTYEQNIPENCTFFKLNTCTVIIIIFSVN